MLHICACILTKEIPCSDNDLWVEIWSTMLENFQGHSPNKQNGQYYI